MNDKRAKLLRRFARIAVGSEGQARELEHVVRKIVTYKRARLMPDGTMADVTLNHATSFNKQGTARSVYRRMKRLARPTMGRA